MPIRKEKVHVEKEEKREEADFILKALKKFKLCLRSMERTTSLKPMKRRVAVMFQITRQIVLNGK